jgi:SPX domain protein involved in polyphosphate accumulation
MQSIFKRYEKKYLITQEQGAALRDICSRYMTPDQYGEYLVQNVYYDTENWDIIRFSLEKPLFKEKLRLRCYEVSREEGELFLELKKKYKGVVYKRRLAIPMKSLSGRTVREIVSDESSQISRELDFYLKANAVRERIYISYRRTAFTGFKDDGLRVTFDTDLRFRLDCLDFSDQGGGQSIIPDGKMLMEIKTLGGIPLWMTHALCENKIYPIAFSKYGVCYTEHILKQEETRLKRTKQEVDQCLTLFPAAS